jgi:hypothetical protein
LEKFCEGNSSFDQVFQTFGNDVFPDSDVGQVEHNFKGILKFTGVIFREFENCTVIRFKFQKCKATEHVHVFVLIENLRDFFADFTGFQSEHWFVVFYNFLFYLIGHFIVFLVEYFLDSLSCTWLQ